MTNPTPSQGAPSGHARPSRLLTLLRRAALATATLLVAVALVYGFENLRGWRTWTQQRDRIAAAGGKIRIGEFLPPPVPDDRNFALIPELRPLLEVNPDRNTTNVWLDPEGWKRAQAILDLGRVHGHPGSYPGIADAVRGRPADLARWQDYFRSPVNARRVDQALRKRLGLVGLPEAPAPAGDPAASAPPPGFPLPPEPGSPAADVLKALAVFDADFAALHEGLKRPDSRFPLRYEDGYMTLLPHLSVLKRATIGFSLRASARLASGDAAGAASDVGDALGLGESLRTEPFMISQLVRQACAVIALGALGEGQTRHAWTEPQLAALQARLSAIDLVAGMRHAIGMERAQALQAVETMAGSTAARRDYADSVGGFADGNPGGMGDLQFIALLLLAPRGWLYANVAATARTLEPLESLDARQIPGLRTRWATTTTRGSPRFFLHDRYFLGDFGKRFADGTIKACATGQRVRLAEAACALERHRLRHGSYPDRLEALVPALLAAVPTDPINGQPLGYATDPDGTFRLWSVGEDGRDEGGAWPRRVGPELAGDEGDWVWRWPEPSAVESRAGNP